MSSSVLSGDSPLSSHAGSPGSTAAHIEEDVTMDDNTSAISTTTERLHDMDLTANPIVTPSPPEPTAATEGEENNVISNAPPPVAKPPTLTEVLKKVLLKKKESAQIAYIRALNNPDVNAACSGILELE